MHFSVSTEGDNVQPLIDFAKDNYNQNRDSMASGGRNTIVKKLRGGGGNKPSDNKTVMYKS